MVMVWHCSINFDERRWLHLKFEKSFGIVIGGAGNQGSRCT
jgi:hypothetical protein